MHINLERLKLARRETRVAEIANTFWNCVETRVEREKCSDMSSQIDSLI